MNQISQQNSSQRLVSLDVFRGMTIALMILVNTPGSWSYVYPFLLHKKWHGILPADLVFPFFLFIIGVSMAFSFSKYIDRSVKGLNKKIIKRVVIIFLIGLLLNYFPFYHKPLAELRIMGVLQRIALAYGLAAVICVNAGNRDLWKIGGAMLLGHWGLLYGLGTGDPYSLQNNISKVIDNFIFGTGHVYHGFGIPFDPEGLFGTIPAAVSVIAGYLVGLKIKETKNRNTLVKNLLFYGIVGVIGGFLWNLVLPVNKPLWTASYVVVTSGAACICLGFLMELIDIRSYRKWTSPFVVFGVNPMILYVVSILLVKTMIYIFRWESVSGSRTLYGWLYQEVFVAISPGNLRFASLLFALFVVFVCWLVGLFLYKRNVIIKV